MVHVATSGKKWTKISKSIRNEIELRYFQHSIRLDELIILVWSFVQIGYKVTKLWPPEVWPKVAASFYGHFGDIFRDRYL